MRRKDREVTEMEEIQQIFDECKVCRIGIMDENGPYIVLGELWIRKGRRKSDPLYPWCKRRKKDQSDQKKCKCRS